MMEGCFSRDLLHGIGRGDAPRREDGPRPTPRVETEEVELSLGLSLGGRFGLERRAEKLARSSSVAAILVPPEKVVLPPALARTSSLPVKADAGEMGTKQGLEGWGSCRENAGLGAEAAARLPGSGSPSSASSDGEGQRLQDPLMRTTSLPAAFDDDSRKRKAAQSLKRHELKKKRIERRNSLTCNISKEAAGQIPEEMNASTEKLESHGEVVTRNKQNHINDKHPMNGLPPVHQPKFASRDCVSSAMRKKHNSAFKGMAGIEGHKPPSDVPLLCEGSQKNVAGRAAARAKSMGDAERIMMQEMPSVSTKGIPNGNRVEGFLYKYRKGEEVRIVCVCHGSFLTPAEFVKHAGGGDIANPLRHIVINPTPQAFQ